MPPLRLHPSLASLLLGTRFELAHSPAGQPLEDLPIAAVVSDSRTVSAGSLFAALPGITSNGHDYLEQAVAKGCTALLCESGRVNKERQAAMGVTVIEVPDCSAAYASVAANYFERPAEKMHFIGITGTNGKTTVSYLLERVLLENGWNVGVIGTVNNRYTLKNGTGRVLGTRFTTPEAYLLQQLLREMADAGVDHVIMEVSSHALAQARIGGIIFDAAAFTNLTRDHLDYHPDMAAYFQAKSLLFSTYLHNQGRAVLPVVPEDSGDNAWLRALHDLCGAAGKRVIGWGEGEKAEIRLRSYHSRLNSTDLAIETPAGLHLLSSPLVGRFNVDNILTVFGLCRALAIEEQLVCQALAAATGAPGRLERVCTTAHWDSHGPVVLVDYAHTPDALEKVLLTVEALPHRQLFCVFGCGGDRDKGKRPLMGEKAARLCDVVVVTDDNPRSEDPEQIVLHILAGITPLWGLPKSPVWLAARGTKEHGCTVIRDRKTAIEQTIRAAGPEDIVVIAGKGHEPYQLTLLGKRFFDDRLEAKNTLLSWTDELVAAAVGGTLLAGSKTGRLLGPVLTDSRIVSSDSIFVALRGENHDAHDFVEQAAASGAACVVVERVSSALSSSSVSRVVVQDTVRALGDLAAFRRKRLAGICAPTVIGITGSCGKTTVKEMVTAILARKWPEGPDYPPDSVLSTHGNFNNLIGLPLSLLPLSTHHRAAVLEMGMNRPGELLRLAEIAGPDISCITNVHGAHLEGLGSIEGVARAKEELFVASPPSATFIVNLDDPWINRLAGKYHHKKVTHSAVGQGLEVKPDFWASDVLMAAGGGITFTIHHRQQTAAIRLFTAGEHNVVNALAAAAIASAAGAELSEIAAGLGDFRPPAKRMEMLRTRSGLAILNDTYNANPASMAAGLKTLRQLAGRTAVAVIGDMRELGDTSRQAHRDIGRLLAELAIDHVGIVGEFKEDVKQEAVACGFPKERIRTFADKDEAVAWIKQLVSEKKLGKDDLILVKASRGLRFETIVASLVENED